MLPYGNNVPFKNMYRCKGVECVRVKDSCLFENVRIVSYRSPVVPLKADVWFKRVGVGLRVGHLMEIFLLIRCMYAVLEFQFTLGKQGWNWLKD